MDLSALDCIRKLGERRKSFLQVLLTEFTLTKQQGGVVLGVSIHDDLDSIVDPDARQQSFTTLRDGDRQPEQRLGASLQRFYEDPEVLAYRFRCPGWPLRYANGGVLPVVRLEGEEYFAFFYRDILPVGWNIANGGSDNLDEMLDPAAIVLREFGEELFVLDHRRRLVYLFSPEDVEVPPGYQEGALEMLARRRPEWDVLSYRRLPIPLQWISGPDGTCVSARGQEHTSGGFFLSVVPEDNSVELDRVAVINLRGDTVLLDGEQSRGILLNQPVGLFPIGAIEHALSRGQREFRPARLFFGAEEREPQDLEQIIEQEYLPALGERRSEANRQAYDKVTVRFDLCPVTRGVSERYLSWRATRLAAQPEPQAEAECHARHAEGALVFISFRSEVESVARWLHDYLAARGVGVFCSSRTLQRLGESDYCRAIDVALDQARCLVVVGMEPEHFDTAWVRYEWRSFFNEIHSGRKPDGQLFTLAGGIDPSRLPYGLRQSQIIPYVPASPQDSFQALYRYIARATESR